MANFHKSLKQEMSTYIEEKNREGPQGDRERKKHAALKS
jgi:hypothetical protein